MTVATTSQLNVRMDARLRHTGDAMLERVGVTPADMVRALWAKIASGIPACEEVLELLAEHASPEATARGEAFLAEIDSRQSELYALAAVDRASYIAPTDEELDEMLYDEWLSHDEERVGS